MPFALPAPALNSSTIFLMIGPPSGSPLGPQKLILTTSFDDEASAEPAAGKASAAAPAAAPRRKDRRSRDLDTVITRFLSPHHGHIHQPPHVPQSVTWPSFLAQATRVHRHHQ